MGRLTATMVVDLKDRTGNTTQSIIGNLNRLQRAERDRDLAERGFTLNRVQRAQEREMIARAAARERMLIENEEEAAARRARFTGAIAAGGAAVAAAGYVAARTVKQYASLERQMTRIGITADASAQQTTAAFQQVDRMAKDLRLPSVEPAIAALDTLVASGQSLEEAMAFLPSVLATAQASGAATTDIANTALKAASALKLQSSELQDAFDIMVQGGKAGQFELKDMAQYIPGLANSFASLGYEGQDGLKRLIAVMQTLREDTGDASSAATQAQNIFGKIYAGETANAFKKMGIDLRREMERAKAAGEDTLSAFIRLTEKALKGDMSKLPQLFTDQEFRLGMQSLLTSEESLRKFIDTLNSAEVKGTVFRDLNRVLTDTQSSLDGMTKSWETLQTSLGKAIAPAATTVMNTVSGNLDYGTAMRETLRKRGMGYWESENWIATQLPLGGLFGTSEAADQAAYEGGYRDPEFMARYNERLYGEGKAKASTGRHSKKAAEPAGPTAGVGVAIPTSPLAAIILDDARRTRAAGMGGTTDTLPGKQADDLDIGRKVTIDGTPSVSLAGTQTVTITNPPPRPNINVQMHVTIQEARNANAVAEELGRRLRSEMDGLQASTNDSGL
ncbi:phage tail tape measure protein [Rhizobium straminoryzae]|uniref:Phage tail tape measure protein n=1 Tax=Rhizobium straminoryzae TaxID=1387186 RepID=A0A549T0U4_9HYPH|nr:phage tail tape measure protein [Rhizobium straminoryzae]TRL35486.1 phage tail tape measure protein [Rhizobium straminoryzae]